MTIRSIFRKLVSLGVVGAVLFFAGRFVVTWTCDANTQTLAQNASFQVYDAFKTTGSYPAAAPTAAAAPGDIGELLNAAGSQSLPSNSAGSNQVAQYWSDGSRYVMVVTDVRSGHHFCIDSGSPTHEGIHQIEAVADCIR